MPPEGRHAHPLTEADASTLARDLYGLEAEARVLPGEFDDNFRLAADGRSFVLKAMHPARERGLVELQCAALRHVGGARAAPAPAPRGGRPARARTAPSSRDRTAPPGWSGC